MTEAEWRTSGHPGEMVAHLQTLGKHRQPGAGRKPRLFSVACCRRIEHLMDSPDSRAAVAFADAHAGVPMKGLRGRGPVERAARAVYRAAATRLAELAPGHEPDGSDTACLAAHAAVWVVAPDATAAARHIQSSAVSAVMTFVIPRGSDELDTFFAEQQAQADLLRCVFGNPFRPVAVDPDWRTATVVALATTIYEGRAWDRLPVLADAREDAGCADPDVLGHLRGPGPHARGCWVVDLLLGKT